MIFSGFKTSRRKVIYDGKAKTIFEGPEPGTVIQYFKDDATAFNGLKKGTITGKGVLNNRISEYLFQHLNDIGVPTHFIRRLNMREQLIREVEIIPLEIVVRNIAAGSFSRRMGGKEGTPFKKPIVEFSYKDDSLGDPFINDDYAREMNAATEEECAFLKNQARIVNDVLIDFFKQAGLTLVEVTKQGEWVCVTARKD